MGGGLAQTLRTLEIEESLGTTLEQRMALLQSLLEDAIAVTIAVREMTREEALDAIAASHKVGRRPSVLNGT